MPPKKKRIRLSSKSRKTANKEKSIREAITTVHDADWRIGRNFTDCMRHMFMEQMGCDVHFLCGDSGERVGAHKFVLFCRSSVFFAMFEGPASDGNKDILVPDIDAVIMRNFLKYLYCEDVDLTEDYLTQMVYVSKKYQVHNLVQECTKFVSKILTVDNACTLMEVSHTFSDPNLQSIVLHFIEDHAVEFLKSEFIKDLCKDCLSKILDSDDLHTDWEPKDSNEDLDWDSRDGTPRPYYDDEGNRTPLPERSEDERSYSDDDESYSDVERSESDGEEDDRRVDDKGKDKAKDQGAGKDDDKNSSSGDQERVADPERNSEYLERAVFECLLTWADAQCSINKLDINGENRQKMATDLVSLVRYRLIDTDYFVTRVAQSGILSAEERIKIIEYRLSPRLSKNPFWNCEKRGPHYHARNFFRFTEESSYLTIPCNGIEALSFYCFEDVNFHGFSVYGMNQRHYAEYTDPISVSVIGKIYDDKGNVLGKVEKDLEDHWRERPEELEYYSYDSDTSDVDRRQPISPRPVKLESRSFDVFLKRKVPLKMYCRYSLVVDLQGDIHTYCGRKGQKFVYDVKNPKKNLIQIEDYTVVGYDGQTSAHSGQIPAISLSRPRHYKDGKKS